MKITSKNSKEAFEKKFVPEDLIGYMWENNLNLSVAWLAWQAAVRWTKRESRKTSRIEEMRKKYPNIRWVNRPILKRSIGVIHRIK